MELLQKSVEQPLIANQLQFGPALYSDAGRQCQYAQPLAIVRDGSVLTIVDCIITIQPVTISG